MEKVISKVYEPNYLSLINNADKSHYGEWTTEKVEEEKQIVQLRQIDKILHGVIKERMFGNLLIRDNQLSLEGYGELQRSTLQNFYQLGQTHASRFSRKSDNSMKKSTLLPTALKTTYGNTMTKTLQSDFYHYERKKKKSKLTPINNKSLKKQLSTQGKINQNERQSLIELNINNIPNIQNYFRKIYNISTNSLIYDSKVTKEQIKNLFKSKNIVSQEIVDRFLYFFDIPSVMHYKQYIATLEQIMNNTNLKQINFFIFQLFDKNCDGLITVEDLFKFIEQNKNSTQILENDAFKCSKALKAKQEKIGSFKVQELTTQQILVRNHTIKIQQYRELVKIEAKQIVNCNIKKSTIYHKSFQALQHNEGIRLKNYQLQSNKSSVDQDRERISRGVSRSHKIEKIGINLMDFLKIFSLDRPTIFYQIMELLTGSKFQHIKK